MIPVDLQPEPEDFDHKVRKPGLDWLAAKGIPVSGPLPAGEKLPSYWRRALQQLGTAYSQVCARLQLDEAKLRRRRASDYSLDLENGGGSRAQAVLKAMSPFVWHEATRQDLL